MQADPECIPALDKVETTLATVAYCSTAEHVPEAERINHVIHERTQERFHRRPYQSLLETAPKVQVMESTKCLNLKATLQLYSFKLEMLDENMQFTSIATLS